VKPRHEQAEHEQRTAMQIHAVSLDPGRRS
jgi:hypothetical protein